MPLKLTETAQNQIQQKRETERGTDAGIQKFVVSKYCKFIQHIVKQQLGTSKVGTDLDLLAQTQISNLLLYVTSVFQTVLKMLNVACHP